jgi:hypothetical protein
MQVVQGDDATRVNVNEMSNIFPVATHGHCFLVILKDLHFGNRGSKFFIFRLCMIFMITINRLSSLFFCTWVCSNNFFIF